MEYAAAGRGVTDPEVLRWRRMRIGVLRAGLGREHDREVVRRRSALWLVVMPWFLEQPMAEQDRARLDAGHAMCNALDQLAALDEEVEERAERRRVEAEGWVLAMAS